MSHHFTHAHALAEPVGGAPTASVVAQEAIANGIVMELILRRGFTAKDFKLNHPGGALGASKRLARP